MCTYIIRWRLTLRSSGLFIIYSRTENVFTSNEINIDLKCAETKSIHLRFYEVIRNIAVKGDS